MAYLDGEKIRGRIMEIMSGLDLYTVRPIGDGDGFPRNDDELENLLVTSGILDTLPDQYADELWTCFRKGEVMAEALENDLPAGLTGVKKLESAENRRRAVFMEFQPNEVLGVQYYLALMTELGQPYLEIVRTYAREVQDISNRE